MVAYKSTVQIHHCISLFIRSNLSGKFSKMLPENFLHLEICI